MDGSYTQVMAALCFTCGQLKEKEHTNIYLFYLMNVIVWKR